MLEIPAKNVCRRNDVPTVALTTYTPYSVYEILNQTVSIPIHIEVWPPVPSSSLMSFLTLSAAFAVYLYYLSPAIFSPIIDDNVNLLLPGFQGHVLQAGLIEVVCITSGSSLPCSSPFPERRVKNIPRYLPFQV